MFLTQHYNARVYVYLFMFSLFIPVKLLWNNLYVKLYIYILESLFSNPVYVNN